MLRFSYPGKTVGKIAGVVDSIAVASDPFHVIIHTGTNNRPSESAESCVTETKSLALKVKNKFPNSRGCNSFVVPRCRLFRGPKEWNGLPDNIKNTKDIDSFKRRLFNKIFHTK